MKSTKFITSFLIILAISFTSCQKDDGNSGGQQQEIIPDSFSEYFGNEISRDFLGTIIDKNNLPIEGVTITIGNETALTDSNGVFIIRDADVNQRFGYVKAEKAGYIHGSRSVVPSEGTNKVNIMLLEANVIATINSGSSETVTLTNGSSVSFDGNFIKEDGSTYSGSVDVIIHHLDPADDDMKDQMPGMLYAQNTEGAERMLQTLGMLAVELRGNSGEELNLADGSTSEIKMPVDASLMSIAPATIPLWYFDEVNGYWKEEGQATLQGNMYVGNVSHFSFWNCDIPAEAVNLCLTITDENGNLLSGLFLAITSENYGTRSGNTNYLGEVCGLVPSNEVLELNITNQYDECGSYIYSTTIGPFSSDSSISISIENINSELITETVYGQFTDCNENPVTNGYVRLFNESNSALLDVDLIDDGDFELSTIRCSASSNLFKLHAVDYVNLQESDSITYTYTTPLTNIGTIASCNTVDEFITYQIDGGTTFTEYFGIQCGIDEESYLSIYYNNATPTGINNQFNFGIGDQSGTPIVVGTYSSGDNYLTFQDQNNATDPNGAGNTLTINISAIGTTGEYIDLTFNGTYLDLDMTERTITGTIHALRDY